jgi:hypothetical protein
MEEEQLIFLAASMKHRAEHSRNHEYFKRLADALMLDELLCGEADPVEFLKNTIIRLRDEIKEEQLESQLKELKNETRR